MEGDRVLSSLFFFSLYLHSFLNTSLLLFITMSQPSPRGRGGSSRGRGGGSSSTSSNVDVSDIVSVDDTGNDDIVPVDSVSGAERGGKRPSRGRGGGNNSARATPRPLKEIPAPDTEGFEVNKAAHEKSLTDLNKRIETLTTKIEALVKTRKGQRAVLRERETALSAVQTERASHFAQYEACKQAIEAAEAAAVTRQREIAALKSSLPFHSVVDCDVAIKALDKRLISSALPPAQERSVIEEMRRLRVIRPQIILLEQNLKQNAVVVDTREQAALRDSSFQQGHVKKDEEEKIVAEVNTATLKEKQSTTSIDDLIAQRRALLTERTQIERMWLSECDAHAILVKNHEAYLREKHWRDTESERKEKMKRQYEERQARREYYEQQKLERAEYEREERERHAREEAERDPYELEKQALEELSRYIAALSLKNRTDLGDDQANGHDAQLDEEREKQNAVLLAQRAKAFKAVQTVATPSAQSVAAEPAQKSARTAKVRVISHVPDVLKLFSRVGVTPPLLSSDLPTTSKQLKERANFYASQHTVTETVTNVESELAAAAE